MDLWSAAVDQKQIESRMAVQECRVHVLQTLMYYGTWLQVPTKGECAYGGRSGVLLLLFFLPMSAVSLTATYREISVTWRLSSFSLPSSSLSPCCFFLRWLLLRLWTFEFLCTPFSFPPPSTSLFPSFCTFFFFFFP